jgi:hypothetical protein
VTGISPASGPLAGGTAVTVTGTGLTSAGGVLTVTFGGRAGSSVVLSSTTSPADQFTYQ